MKPERTIRSRRVVLPQGIAPATITVRDGVILEAGPYDRPADDDMGDLVIMPGLVDTHVHINEPGRTEWEGFLSATKAAAAGGITTLIEMPLNSIPATISVKAFQKKPLLHKGSAGKRGFLGARCPEILSTCSHYLTPGVLDLNVF